ncbi:MAG: hypothetical protein A2V77_09560 [Anaeromyxobacter sp. RBG_16_69_14]|nr:MAG: hypothetical protein A2V77_09560 [Anaeromyxobacter sp. RBG_16_69_14]
MLGRTESAKVLVRVDEQTAADAPPLRLSVNVGSFSEPERVAPGRYRALYVPPRTRFPQMALVAVWRETGPEARVDFVRFPLLGTTRLAVKAPPGSAVSAKVGPDEFGPVAASAKGKAILPIVAPPGVRQATVVISGGSGPVLREVALEVPPYNRLIAAVVPATAPADGKTPVRLHVFYDVGGAEVPADRVRVTASEGQTTLVEASQGRYSYRYVPTPGSSASEVRFQIAVDGDPAARAGVTLALVAPTPKAASVQAAPVLLPAQVVPERRATLRQAWARFSPSPVLADGVSWATLALELIDEAGKPVEGAQLVLAASAGAFAKVVERGRGRYEASYRAPDRLEATVRLADPGSGFERTIPVPLRVNPGRFLLGPRVGFAHSVGDLSGVRVGIDAWMPVRLGPSLFGLGFSLTRGSAARTVSDPGGSLRSSSSADFYPLAGRLGYELWAGQRLSFVAGLGYTVALAHFTSALGGAASEVGTGPLGFASAAYAIGPGHLFAEASASSVPVAAADFKLEAGGLSLEGGYRLRIF